MSDELHEGFNTLQKPVNIKASASLIIHIWSKLNFMPTTEGKIAETCSCLVPAVSHKSMVPHSLVSRLHSCDCDN